MNLSKRHGDNLYPVEFSAQFGSYSMDLDVPEGVWNPTPHGVHLGNILTQLDFQREHVLEGHGLRHTHAKSTRNFARSARSARSASSL